MSSQMPFHDIDLSSNAEVKPPESISLWVKSGDNMTKISPEIKPNSLVMFYQHADTDKATLRCTGSNDAAKEQLLSLLVYLHDYCSGQGLVPPRAWDLSNTEPQGMMSGVQPVPGTRVVKKVVPSQIKANKDAEKQE